MFVTTLSMWSPGPTEIIIVLVIALLLFGKRLPEVGKSMGKGIVEFKRGLRGVEDEIEDESRRDSEQEKAKGEEEEDEHQQLTGESQNKETQETARTSAEENTGEKQQTS